MKQIAYFAALVALLVTTGCSKQEEKPAATGEQPVAPTKDAVTPAKPKATESVIGEAKTAAKETKEAAVKKMDAATSSFTVKKDEVMGDLGASLETVKSKVAGLDKESVMAYAGTYKEVIAEKAEEFVALKDSLKGVPVSEMFGEKGKALKDEVARYAESLSGLKERYSVYLDKLKEYGVDLSAYGL